MGKPGSMADKAPSLRTQISQTSTPPSSLVRLCHQLDSASEKCHWLGLLLGSAGINSVYQDWMLVVGSLSAFSVTVRFQGLSSKDSLAIFMLPQCSPHSWRAGDWMSHLGFLSCCRNDRFRRDPLMWFCTGLGRRAILSACSNSSYPSNSVCLGAGWVLQHLRCDLEFSKWYLVH